MLSSRASGPARWVAAAARTVSQTNVATAQPLPIPAYHRQSRQQQQRQYAGLLRRRPRQARPDAAGGLIFEGVDIPPIHWWEGFQKANGLGGLTPENCLSAFAQYCSVATNNGSDWKRVLEREHDIGPHTLHYTALPLLNMSGTPALRVGMHMLFAASSLGYTPSTLTLMGFVVRSTKEQEAKMQSWRDVNARFRRLLDSEKNPDAFTLQGLLLLRESSTANFALRYFDKAIEAARDIPPEPLPEPAKKQNAPAARKPRWDLEGFCHKNRGLLLLKQDRTEEARAAFEVLALELDHPDGYAELAKLLPRDAPDRETYLLKAAQSGNFEACRLLALDMADRAADPALPRKDRVFAAGLAREWATVEPDAVKRENVQAEVAEKTRAVSAGG